MSEVVSVPRLLLKELCGYFAEIEEILATLEELLDKEGLERIKKSLEEYDEKEYVTINSREEMSEVSTC